MKVDVILLKKKGKKEKKHETTFDSLLHCQQVVILILISGLIQWMYYTSGHKSPMVAIIANTQDQHPHSAHTYKHAYAHHPHHFCPSN